MGIMYEVKCLYDNEYRCEQAYSVTEFPFNQLKAVKEKARKSIYLNIPATFDIETTTYQKADGSYEGYMYIWQMCIEGLVVFGRSWNEWQYFLNELVESYKLCKDKKLVVYVHNLSFEFEFIRDFIDFTDIFATDARKILTAKNEFFEFRCSYRLSNMNLNKIIQNTPNTHHNKGINDLDYRTIRTQNDNLTAVEYGYCYNDVLGLYEAIMERLKDDSLKSIPLTSTGYVRRDCRLSMRKNKKNRQQFLKEKLTLEQYQLLKQCFRGGNTASNRYHANEILENVFSWDITSSYPYVMLSEQYPAGQFMKYSIEDAEELDYLNSKFCTIGTYIFTNIKVNNNVPIPYIPTAKCLSYNNINAYNGRILSADSIAISLTNVDLDIIENQYSYEGLYIEYVYFARKDYLPKELRNEILKYFIDKSTLKGVKGKEYEYTKKKNSLNSVYGMTVTDIIHNDITIKDGKWIKNAVDPEAKLKEYYASWNNFLSYQWGVFVTAYARRRLQQALDLVGLDVVYCDTDSVKYVHNHDADFNKLNNDTLKYTAENEIEHSVEINGKKYVLGLWDYEGCYDAFKTLGAKKYADIIDNHIEVTVAGLSKVKGAAELERGKGLEDFTIGKVFTDSGRTVAYFNNQPVHTIEVNGCKMITGSNIAIVDTTYTLGITDTMLDIIEYYRNSGL